MITETQFEHLASQRFTDTYWSYEALLPKLLSEELSVPLKSAIF